MYIYIHTYYQRLTVQCWCNYHHFQHSQLHIDLFDSNDVAVTEASSGEEGLSAYAMDTIPEDLLQQAENGPGMASEGINRVWVSLNNRNPAVVENLQGLAKVVLNRHLPRVQAWLKVLVKVSIHPDCKNPSPLPLPPALPQTTLSCPSTSSSAPIAECYA